MSESPQDAKSPSATVDAVANGPVVLCIIDGVGERAEARHNAVKLANTPHLDKLRATFPSTTLLASGPAVGLRPGEAGCGDVGHRVLGAGRPQVSLRQCIDKDMLNGRFDFNDMVQHLLTLCDYNNYKIHMYGLLSDAGVHAHVEHLYALIDVAVFRGVPVVVHAFVDGRDTSSQCALDYLRALDEHIHGKDVIIGTIAGRFYAMDRDRHWDRSYEAFHAMVRNKTTGGDARQADTIYDAISHCYEQGYVDEFIPPVRIGDYRGMQGDFMCDFSEPEPIWRWHAEAAGLCFNYRADRMRQLNALLTRSDVPEEIANDILMDRNKPVQVFQDGHFGTLAQGHSALSAKVGYRRERLADTLGEVLAKHGIRQFRCSESERFAHITTAFSGGHEQPFEGEVRRSIASPRFVESFADKPQMSVAKVAAAACEALASGDRQFIVVNFANVDLVAHSGQLDATISALEAADEQLGKLSAAAQAAGASLIVTSSHGNSESMRTEISEPDSTHTTNPVPFIYCHFNDSEVRLRNDGTLADVAPTVLELFGLPVPEAMSGRSLREPNS